MKRGDGRNENPPLTIRGWRPPKKLDVHLPDLEKNLEDTGRAIDNFVTGAIDNTVSDSKKVLGAVSECLAAVDSIRVLEIDRFLEYQTALTSILNSASVSPVVLIQDLFVKLDPSLRRDPKSKLWRLENPEPYLLNQEAPNCTQIFIDTPLRHRPGLLFVHGKGCD